MTTEQPKCTAADGRTTIHTLPGVGLVVSAVDFNRLHAENEALKQALAQGEPVAWINEDQTIGPDYGKKYYSDKPYYSLNPLRYKHTPLYTTPQPQREWVGLTDEDASLEAENRDIGDWHSGWIDGAKWANAKLREKNGGGA